MMTKRLQEINDELREMAEREAYNLYRLAWRAKAHGCKPETVEAIREEARRMYSSITSNPGWLLDWKAKSQFKYAFCGERIKHTYLVVNEDGEVIRMERR